MPNHVHLIAIPETKEGLNAAIGETHRRYNPEDQFSGRLARSFVAGAVFFIHYGRTIPGCLHPVCGVESGPCGFGGEIGRMAITLGPCRMLSQ